MKERNRKRHKARRGGAVKRVLALIMAFNMSFGLIPETPFAMKAKAADPVSVKTITGLGTGAITNPVQPAESGSAWSGSYVYYGIYNNEWLEKSRYRVLDRASDKFGVEGGSLFLDCDKIIYTEKFSTADSEEWASSDIKASLNGEAFLTMPGNFTDVERNAIAESRVEVHPLKAGNGAGQVDSYSKNEFVNYTALNGEKVFLLDVEDASNIAYGYSTTSNTAQNRVKTGTGNSWWLRSADKDTSYHEAGLISFSGIISPNDVNGIMSYGVSPAFNLSLSSVLFSSLISGNAGEAGAEYKLTLKDGDISIAAGSGGTWDASGLVSIPYSITDNSSIADPTQVSAVVTDGTWTGDGWSEGAKLLQYAKLETESLGTSGTGTFTLDSSIIGTWGSDYHVYILAEDVNGEKETDYASVPVEIKAVTVIAAGFNGEYDGQTHKADITVAGPADGWTLRYGEAADACTSETSPALTDVSDSPRIIYYQVTADGYLTATGSVTIQIAKATPDFIAPTKIDRLRYNGQERELVTAGSTNFGKVLYSLDGTNYSEEIPRGTEAGTYTVYYKVEGGDNWKAIDAQMVEVTIAEPISYPVIGLGLGTISNPKAPETDNSPWSGSFVYYGIYNGIPTKFRVLDKASDKFGVVGGSLFLDCDSTLYGAKFDKDAAPNQGATTANAWAYSDIKADLNGDSFLTKSGNFTEVEKSAIAESTVESHQLKSGTGAGQVAYDTLDYCTEYTALAGEKIFLLDYEDASNIAYGYSTTDDAAKNRKKVGSNIEWWLRSPSKGDSTGAGNVDGYGNLWTYGVDFSIGVSPAFNVSLSSILLSSMIAGEDGQPGAEYKLTLKDSGLSIETANGGTRNASGVVSIPYTIVDNSSSAEPTQVSVVVTDGTWTESGWSDGADLLQYEKLTVESFGTSGTGTFTLNSSISGTWGTDYHVYILAEDVNGKKETDYASAPVEIKAITASATDYEGTYDGQAHGISVSITDPTSGAIVKYGESADSCTSETCPTITNVNDSPKIVYYQIEAEGYLTAKGSAVVTINKAEPTVTPPTAKNLTYTGSAQALVTAGSTDFGTVLYSLDGETYSEEIPRGTDAGTYTVFYKVDTENYYYAPQVVEVTISQLKPVFKSHTLLLSGQIGVNFYMDLSMLTADEKATAVMEFTVNGKKTTDNFDAGCLNPSSGNYYGFTCYINAVQMADEITAVLNYGDGKTVSQTYSVAEYISYINEHPEGYSNNTIKLVQAIADYGHYSQPFLASNNSWTLGTDHVVMNGWNLYDISDAEAAKTAVSGNVFTSDTGDSMVEKVTYSLSLESETVLNIYLKMKEGYTGSVTASVGGNAVDAIQQSDGRYRIQIKNIAADKLGDIYEIAISAGGNCTVSASALSYVNAVLNSEKESLNNDTAHYAVTALYRYYRATKNYAENPTE